MFGFVSTRQNMVPHFTALGSFLGCEIYHEVQLFYLLSPVVLKRNKSKQHDKTRFCSSCTQVNASSTVLNCSACRVLQKNKTYSCCLFCFVNVSSWIALWVAPPFISIKGSNLGRVLTLTHDGRTPPCVFACARKSKFEIAISKVVPIRGIWYRTPWILERFVSFRVVLLRFVRFGSFRFVS